MRALLLVFALSCASVSTVAAAPRHRRHIVCAVAPVEGVGLFRFCPVTTRHR